MNAPATAVRAGGAGSRGAFVFSALGGLLFGYDTGIIAGAILFIRRDFGLDPLAQRLVVSSLLLGALVGAAGAGYLSDRLGRRRLLLAAGVVFTVGALGAALAPTTAVLVAFRVVLGLAIGAGLVFEVFAGFGVLAFILTALFLRETTGRSLEAIELGHRDGP